MGEVAIAVANAMGAGLREAVLPDTVMRFAKQAAADLIGEPGRRHGSRRTRAPADAHALVHWINGKLQAPVDLIEPSDQTADGRQPGTLPDLARDLAAGVVDTLVVIGANPGYDAPADLEFAKHAAKAAFRLHAGCYADETAALSTWHVPHSPRP